MTFDSVMETHQVYATFASGDEPRLTDVRDRESVDVSRIIVDYSAPSDPNDPPFFSFTIRGYRVKADGTRDLRSAGDKSLSWYGLETEVQDEILNALTGVSDDFATFCGKWGQP